ncbi:glutamate receptor ionotropic, delta-1 [Procambarus clarkii]|uniref:glutamate receptor ionotropic, delta-1 n=1 Tax=Procambarus clarkii TaxID=6728 RepID=UPI001E671592|nr:glutamate receptor ionotropic, delta-1-like [Procambarus clarkii]
MLHVSVVIYATCLLRQSGGERVTGASGWSALRSANTGLPPALTSAQHDAQTPGSSGPTPAHNGITSLLASRAVSGAAEGRRVAALVDFVVRSSTGRQLYLLHDLSFTEASPAVEASYRSDDDTAVFRYTEELREFEAAVRTYFHVVKMRNVLVFCSPQHTLHIFEQVRARALESASLYWFVVMEEDVTSAVLDTLREGTQMTVVVRRGPGHYELLVSHVDHTNTMRLEHIGWWKWSSSRGATSYLQRPLYRDLSEVYSDFGGRVLRSAAVENWPYFQVTPQADGSIKADSGIDYNILTTVGEKLNFTFLLVEAKDGQWGGKLANGTITGMIGLVARHEADVAIDELTITAPRGLIVDFTAPYYLEATTLVSPAPTEKNRAFAVFSPFSAQLWVTLCVVTLCMGPVLRLVTWLRGLGIKQDEKQRTLQTFSFNAFRVLVVQTNRIISKHWELRLIFFTWYFFCFVVYAMYSGTLTAVLALPSFEKPIDSLADLLYAVKHKKYKPIVVLGTSNEFVFREAKSGIYKEVWDVFDPKVGYVENYSAGMDKVPKGKYVFLNAKLGAEIRAVVRGKNKYYFAKTSFYPQGYGIVCTKGSPYRDIVSKLLTRFGSAGLVLKWIKDEVRKVSKREIHPSTGPGAITMVHLQAAFFLLTMGYLLAGSTLLVEKLVHFHLDSLAGGRFSKTGIRSHREQGKGIPRNLNKSNFSHKFDV